MKSYTRRSALKKLTLLGAGSTVFSLPINLGAAVKKPNKPIKLGVITDTHIGFVPKAETRLTAFLKEMKTVKPDALAQLGDFAFPDAAHQKYADQFNAAHDVTLHAIGNHDLDKGLKKSDCIKAWDIPARYYTKDVNGIRIIVLDGNDKGSPTYKSHGGYHKYIAKEQRDWLADQLGKANIPVLVLSHQPMAGPGEVDNGAEMRALFSQHKSKIIACINGHAHIDHHIESGGVNYLHLNSASYYWLGGKVRLAAYKDPLYATITIDAQASTLTVEGKKSTWEKGTPEDVNYFKGKRADWKQFVHPEISSRNIKII
ncbi:MAG: metallophosphoesterase family protein [Akkermansiaceae bacterium]